MKYNFKKIITVFISCALLITFAGCGESWYDGNLLKTYEGKCDIEENDSNKVLFDIDGKRVIIYNAVVIAEEIIEDK